MASFYPRKQLPVVSSRFSVRKPTADFADHADSNAVASCQFLVLSNSLKVSVPICIAKFVILPLPLAARGRLPKIFVCPAYLLVKIDLERGPSWTYKIPSTEQGFSKTQKSRHS